MTKYCVSFIWFLFLALALCTDPACALESSLSPRGKLFVKYAASVGLMEMQLAQMANQKGISSEVKELANRMAFEHFKANDQLAGIAKTRNLKMPDGVARRHQPTIAKLHDKTGSDFDKGYMKATIENNIQLRDRLKWAIRKVQDQELKAWAAKTLPMVEQLVLSAKVVAQNLTVPVP